MTKTARNITLTVVAMTLSGCGSDGFWASGEQQFPPSETGSRQARRETGSIFDIFGGAQVGNVQFGEQRRDPLAGNVNRHLWQASLDTLAFLPLTSTDPFTGVIATDWGAPPDAPDERFKVTAFVTDATLDANALRVAVFRERRDGSGAWVPATVAAETPREIEDAILVRARQLRLAERQAG
jgi:hypothetical protein